MAICFQHSPPNPTFHFPSHKPKPSSVICNLSFPSSSTPNSTTSPPPVLSSVRTFAPATIANLGPCFDFLGCAVDSLGDYVSLSLSPSTPPGQLSISDISSDPNNKLSLNPLHNCAGIAALSVMKSLNVRSHGLALSLHKGLPLGSGLGSSAASAAAAAIAVNALFGDLLSPRDLVLAGLESEAKVSGYHADNIAPAIMGGFVLIESYQPLTLTSLRFPGEREVLFVLVTPEFEAPTKKMREVLPKEVTMGHCVWNGSQGAALVAAVMRGDVVGIGRAMSNDRIVEPKRMPLIPGMEAVKKAAIEGGAYGCTISGAGPTAVAIVDREEVGRAVGERMVEAFRKVGGLGATAVVQRLDRVPARAAAAAAVARALATLPPDQRQSLPLSSAELSSIYGSRPGPTVVELEEEFYDEEFDPVMYVLDHIPLEEDELEYYENKAAVRLDQLDVISTRLSRHVMEHHEEMVKGMQLVRELERDLKIATVICMNGRRHLTSSMQEVSRDLIVTENSKKKQTLLDLIPVLTELRHAQDMRKQLETLVEEGNFCKAFQVLSEYLQLLDIFSELSAAQEMSHSVEVWLGNTLQKLDSLLLQVCQVFREEKYVTVIDAYALIGDVSGLAEKIQSFFLQEVLSETHSAVKSAVQEDQGPDSSQNRLTYSDLCLQVPESKFRNCLLSMLAVLFRLMCSYYAIMNFQPENEMQSNLDKQCVVSSKLEEVRETNISSGPCESNADNMSHVGFTERLEGSSFAVESTSEFPASASGSNDSIHVNSLDSTLPMHDNSTSSSGSPWYELRRDATVLISQSLQRGRKNLWQLVTSRVSVLLSSSAFCSTSIHQFIRNYEDLNIFVLAGEAFCGIEAAEFRKKLKAACESYYNNFHKQNIYALKMVLEKESWQTLPPDAVQVVAFAGLVGDGAPLIASSDSSTNNHLRHPNTSVSTADIGSKRSGFSPWLKTGNPFLQKASSPANCHTLSPFADGLSVSGDPIGTSTKFQSDKSSTIKNTINHANGETTIVEDENEDLLADFIDEDSQLPSRSSKPRFPRNQSSQWKGDEASAQTGSSLCLMRFMDKYARLMQKLGMVNVELFKGLCQLFEMYFYFVFETFGHQDNYVNGKGVADTLNFRLKSALNRAIQDSEQWLRPQPLTSSSSLPASFNSTFKNMDVTPSRPGTNISHFPGTFSLKERCVAVDTIFFVARVLHRSKPHLQSMLLQNNPVVVEDFFLNLVDSVPDLTEHIHRTTARFLLHIVGYIDRIANAKWEVKELGMEHNGYVDLLLGEFKHYTTRIAHAGIQKEVQDLLLEYGVEIVAETLVEGLSRIKRCTDEGRALMSLDLQVLINGLQHFVPKDVKPKLQIVEVFIKAYYLPETEYVHWARAHPEYSKSQIVGLVNLVATMKGWKRKTRLETLEKIE